MVEFEYGVFSLNVREYLDWKDNPMYNPLSPNNCLLNVKFSLDSKGVSHIY